MAARLGAITTFALFALIVLGSVVRTTGSGLACPDWPLCQGRLIPPLEFHVLIEWSHRTVALLVSALLFTTMAFVFVRREVRARLGGMAAATIGLLLIQVLLGALTVWKLLHPPVVNTHLAVALLLLGGLLLLTAEAEARAGEEPVLPDVTRTAWLPVWLGTVTVLVFAQIVLGGTVSSQHAGLACPDWPACNGEWLPPLGTLAGIQMLHRGIAYLLLAAMALTLAFVRSTGDRGVMAGAKLGLALTFTQIVLGVCNVLLALPPWLSVLHLAVAALLLVTMVLVTHRAARIPVRASASAPRRATPRADSLAGPSVIS
jgi:cytochrome c oxidase assembly protein subunit 15